ncbi:hypothetical protein BU26DRAFT_203626 [Trematosphaeria pertusa]|uniref:Uncharacterized protein n=1 Tax=Trematosphaeria pertusa TaxID=390896 RepID=A0A6A6HSX0_9PLEO|nr:uncharacterized protein BU26DRAFT_203626 [Trematosphaeria pertusa]KAF2240623.1 hypothetical protein BU26DRAFT_203626 [Trematosphaeria pertusa]
MACEGLPFGCIFRPNLRCGARQPVACSSASSNNRASRLWLAGQEEVLQLDWKVHRLPHSPLRQLPPPHSPKPDKLRTFIILQLPLLYLKVLCRHCFRHPWPPLTTTNSRADVAFASNDRATTSTPTSSNSTSSKTSASSSSRASRSLTARQATQARRPLQPRSSWRRLSLSQHNCSLTATSTRRQSRCRTQQAHRLPLNSVMRPLGRRTPVSHSASTWILAMRWCRMAIAG